MSENQTTNNPAATQGGNEGPGHVPTDAPADTIYSFNSLKEQKHAAEDKYMARAAASAGEEPPAQQEDTSFMNHKPGGGETLPGWDTMKGMFTGKSE